MELNLKVDTILDATKESDGTAILTVPAPAKQGFMILKSKVK